MWLSALFVVETKDTRRSVKIKSFKSVDNLMADLNTDD